MADAQYLTPDPPLDSVARWPLWTTAPAAAPLTRAEETALREALRTNARTLRRVALAVVPFATGLGGVLAWVLFVDMLPTGHMSDGPYTFGEAFSLLIVVVLWNALVVWGLWDEALDVPPGFPGQLAFPTPRTVEGTITPASASHEFRGPQKHRVRFPTHWTPPKGRVRLRVVEAPRRRWARGRLGRAPLVLGVETDETAASPPSRTPRSRWVWDPALRTLVPTAAPPQVSAYVPVCTIEEDLAAGTSAELRYPIW